MLGLKFHQKNFYRDIYHFIISLFNDERKSGSTFRKNMGELFFYCDMSIRNHTLFQSVPPGVKTDQESEDDKINKLIKEILLNYAYQDIKWTFAGTTFLLTDISKGNLEKNNIRYEDLLPVELKNKNKGKVFDNKIYIYPDGTCSQGLYKKAKITYKDLADRSGFDWEKGYSFENKVRNKKWNRGFNSKGTWEIDDPDKKTILKSDYILPLDISDDNNFTFLIIHNEEKGEDEAVLFDNDAVLSGGKEKRFYDNNGKLCKTQKINVEKSLDDIKEFFNKNGLNKVIGIVVNNKEKKIKEYYKKILKDFSDETLKFYTPDDPEIKLLLQNHYPGSGPDKCEKKHFDIISNKNDLNGFLKVLAVNKKITADEKNEVASFIKNLKIPQNKREQISILFQNILIMDRNFFTKINLKRVDLLEIVHKAVINKKFGNESKIRCRMNLYDFITMRKDHSAISSNLIPDIDYKTEDLRSAGEVGMLLKENNFLKNIDDSAVSVLSDKIIKLPEKKRALFLKRIRETYNKINTLINPSIINPEEIPEAVYNIITKRNISSYKKRELILEKRVDDFISDFNVKAPSFVKRGDKRMKKCNFVFKDKIDFFDESDLYIFKRSQIFNDLNPENREKIIEFIGKTYVPENKRDQFNSTISKILIKHHNDAGLMKEVRRLKKTILKCNNNSISVKNDLENIIKIPHQYSSENSFKKDNSVYPVSFKDKDIKNDLFNDKEPSFNQSDLKIKDAAVINDQSNGIREMNNSSFNGRNVIKKIYLADDSGINYCFNLNNENSYNNSKTYSGNDFRNEMNNDFIKTDNVLIKDSEKTDINEKYFNQVDMNYYEDKKRLSNENIKPCEKTENNLEVNNAEEIEITVDEILKIIKREMSDEL